MGCGPSREVGALRTSQTQVVLVGSSKTDVKVVPKASPPPPTYNKGEIEKWMASSHPSTAPGTASEGASRPPAHGDADIAAATRLLREESTVHDYGNGDIYKGQMKSMRRHGKGTMVWQNGHSYEGDWEEDKMHGEGEYRWPDGQVYVGEFNHGKKEGMGVMQYADGETKYVGGFVNNEPAGSGVWYLPGGQRRLTSS
uniref:MORN repeat-containing protein 5 n=1 Tax=Hemiselmis andersenii TaxID=464988 RepID=A0A7S1DHT2_HEMAN|mmetsp:Transcript_15211/g.36851  ORF Transcript_15211/g.36851 Transcript_15211/m.36851 type:complete len:198 (+) Transcript_15211:67-660(+)